MTGQLGMNKRPPLKKIPQQLGQICPKHMTTTQHGMVQKRFNQTVEAATAFTGESKNILGTESYMESGSLYSKGERHSGRGNVVCQRPASERSILWEYRPLHNYSWPRSYIPPKLELQSCKWSSYPAASFHTHMPHLPYNMF